MIAEAPRLVAEPVPEPIPGPPLPLGRRIELPGRGTTFVREVAGPPGAPTLVLLHGWIASGGLNWFRAFEPLSEHFYVIAPDLRGHGRGIRSRRRFRLTDCADDVAALMDVLGAGPAIMVGYSLGGPVAQLLWRRHPEKVSGMVLCATAHSLMPGVRESVIFSSAMAALAGTTRVGQVASRIPVERIRRLFPVAASVRPSSLRRWARAEMGRHDWRMVLEAGRAMGTYSARKWIGDVDVPTAVVVTTRDRGIPPLNQLQMALAIPDATIHRLDDGHTACAKRTFAPPLVAACLEVAARIDP